MLEQPHKLTLAQLDPSCVGLVQQAEALQASEIFPPLLWDDPWRVYTAMIGSSVVGVANAVFKHDEIIVETMCVSPEYRNRGIGSALMNSVTAAGAQKGCNSAWVTPLNYMNERLYRRLGFDFPPGCMLTMHKPLS